MGGRGSGAGLNKGGAEIRQFTSLANAPSRNILNGKTGTEKQKAYAEKLTQMTKNTIDKKVKERRSEQKFWNEKLKNSKGVSNTKISDMQQKIAKEGMLKSIKSSNKDIRFYTQNLKKASRQKTYGQIISVLGG